MSAAVVALMLVFAGVVPPFALAEADSEGEGSAAPGALPGLEEAEPGGGETLLEEAPPMSGETEAEEAPPPTPEAGETAAVGVPESLVGAAGETAPAPEGAQPAAPTPPAAAPVYGIEESAPTYQPASPSAPAVVRNEAIVAPDVQRPEAPRPGPAASRRTSVGEGVVSIPEPVGSPEPVVSEAASRPTSVDPVPKLEGRRSYTVAPGDCLWTIAAALLRRGASSAEIEAEVAHLWQMNAARIGTGDPSLVLMGTVLRLG
ncbi:MAG: hypothetical protein JSU06_03935 [Actinobacteria bacterium]|nr:hypothetical protein [Actinomycetota bacterium]